MPTGVTRGHSMRSSYWRGRRVLVTGHTGFKGAWLSTMLLHLGARVSGLALPPPSAPNLFDLLALGDEVNSHIADVRDEQAVWAVMEMVRPEYVFHLAAQSLVRAGYDRPVETYATNVLGTAHVLEACRRCEDVRGIVVVTSDKCYRNREWSRAYREDDELGGEDPYSSSKAAAEIITHAYTASFGGERLRIASARAGNVIGGGDWAAERLVPDVVRAALAGHPPVLRYPQSVRPWQHVLEPLGGYLMLAQALGQGDYSGGWNFGPDRQSHLTVAQLACALLEAFGRPTAWDPVRGKQPHEAEQLRLDSRKSRVRLGWRSKLDAMDTVAWTVAWYRAWHEGKPPREITLGQIAEYLER